VGAAAVAAARSFALGNAYAWRDNFALPDAGRDCVLCRQKLHPLSNGNFAPAGNKNDLYF